jgi:hypothetical protein
MYNPREREPLTHPVNLSGMKVGDFFFFCDECGYQHKTNYMIAGRCHCGTAALMLNCTVTREDRSIWNSAVKAVADGLGEADARFEEFLIKAKG